MIILKQQVNIEAISTYELGELLKLQKNDSEKEGLVEGFSILRKNVALQRVYQGEYSYFWQEGLRPFEKQPIRKDFNHEYDINVIAIKGEKLIGISRLEWKYDSYGKDSMWNYRSDYIDVKEKGKGIGKNMLIHLEKLPEIQGKILRFGEFTPEGEKFIKPTIRKIFCNDNYFILPKKSFGFQRIPTTPGCYLRDTIN